MVTDDARTRRLRALLANLKYNLRVRAQDLRDPETNGGRSDDDAADMLLGFELEVGEILAVLDTEGDRPAQLPCGCYITQCPTHRSQLSALPDPPVQP
jgi:hypothetical protein